MPSSIQQMWDQIFVPKDRYRLARRLAGHNAAINCFAFARDGEQLASGGDDETVRIWTLEKYKCVQVIHDNGGKWGQITCVKWLASEAGVVGETLCFGTGRGMVSVYRQSRLGGKFVELSNTRTFAVSDSVEALAFDPTRSRLATSSHYGQVHIYCLEKNGTLVSVWNKHLLDVTIPRAIHFVGGYQSLLVFSLESGEISCRDAETSMKKWSKVLKSGIGNASICPSEKFLLIDNLTTGFDLYNITRTSPVRSFSVPVTRRYVKKGVFAEQANAVVCGSDHGGVYVFNTNSEGVVQTLHHDGGQALVQTVEAISSPERHLIASGSSENCFDICIWEKPTKQAINKRKKADHALSDRLVMLNGLVLFLILYLTSNLWVPALVQGTESITSAIQKCLELHTTPAFKKTPEDPWARFADLDEAKLRQLLGMKKVTMEEVVPVREEGPD